jgi:hypothetical protein
MPFPFRLDSADVPDILRASRLRVGKLRMSGVPAILFGAAAIVIAAGVAETLREAAPKLPETLREAKSLLDAQRAKRALTP